MRYLAPFLVLLAVPASLQAQRGIRFERPPDMLPDDLQGESRIEAGDLDRDGDVDLVLTDGTNYPARWHANARIWWNEGGGRFREERGAFGNVYSFRGGAALADIDGDGDPDILSGGDPLQVLINQFPGPFVPVSTHLAYERLFPRHALVADFDLDGFFDVFLAMDGQDRLFYAQPSAPWTFQDQSGLLPSGLEESDLAVAGDWDRDGLPDLAVMGGGSFRVYRQTPGPYLRPFTLSQEIQLPEATTFESGDLDLDGDLDFFVGRDGQDLLLLNDGAGSFRSTLGRLPAHFGFTAGVALGDHDGDGDLDAALVHRGDIFFEKSRHRLLRNDGQGKFTDAGWLGEEPLRSQGILAEDLDLDGDEDLLVLTDYAFRNSLYLSDGAGGFSSSPSSVPGFAHDLLSLEPGEFDGEPGVDLALLNWTAPSVDPDNRLLLYTGDDLGRLKWKADALPFAFPGAKTVTSSDFDGDGSLDLFLYSDPSGSGAPFNSLLLNDGRGHFRDASSGLPPLMPAALRFAAGDLDGDGDQDLFLADSTGRGTLGLLLNRGDGTFIDASSSMPAWAGFPFEAVELADLDLDGDLDAIAGPMDGHHPLIDEFHVYHNNGSAVFTEFAGAIPASLNVLRVSWALADFDRDGDPDFACIDPTNGEYLLLPNDGASVFGPAVPGAFPPVQPRNTRRLEAVDLEGDGDWDLAACATFGEHQLFLNDGNGFFRLNPIDVPVPQQTIVDATIGFADFDADGDADMLVGGWKTLRFLLNLDRQVRWRSLPRSGKPLEFEVHGTPGGGYTLLSSARPADVSTPYGRLRVDLLALTGVRRGRLDAEGGAVEATFVPANPALVGTSFYLQALLDSPLRFSNLEVAEITPF